MAGYPLFLREKSFAVSDRPHRKGLAKEKALEILQDEAEKGKLDMDIVKHLLEIVC